MSTTRLTEFFSSLLTTISTNIAHLTKTTYPTVQQYDSYINHDYDELLKTLYHRVEFWQSWGETRENLYRHSDYYNPEPGTENNKYNSLPRFDQFNMMLKNNLFLSRRFIQNAENMKLREKFEDKPIIRILDIGCGLSTSLLGLMAYFGEDRVDYLGVDIEERLIDANNAAYKSFKNVKFLSGDFLKLLPEREYKNQFDLVLIQHPNFLDAQNQAIFQQIFTQVPSVMAEGAVLYSTFYYLNEADYFRSNVLDKLNQALGACSLIESKTSSTFMGGFPEQAVFISPQSQLVLQSTEEARLDPSTSFKY